MCLVCGLDNHSGLQAAFYELSGDVLLGVFDPGQQHQGYPGRLHGGVASSLLDETLGRTIMIHEPDAYWGVTINLQFRFRHPIPIDQPVRAVARLTANTRRSFRASGRILLDDGKTAVEAHGRFLKMELDRIADFDPQQQRWSVQTHPSDPTEVEI